ncbi:aspartate kinase [Neoconidiobolus thromboides FSU 785]|nr:aspartate kinase [Neoconidiobolus thromboides FSU 785]
MDNSTSSWLINKFGGISVGCYLLNIPSIVQNQLNKGYKVALVCSARSNIPHKTKAITSRLLKLMSTGENRTNDTITLEANTIIEEHIEELKSVINNSTILEPALLQIVEEHKRLLFLLEALQVIGETSHSSLDLIVSIGERLACIIIVALLKQNNISVEYLDLSKKLATELKDGDYDSVVENLKLAVNKEVSKDCKVLFIILIDHCYNFSFFIGFMGPFPCGLLNTVGRGYSDITASCLSVALKATELIVWKHIDGIYTADPSIVKESKILPFVTIEEAYELTYYGTEAVHPMAIEIASKQEITIRICNVNGKDQEIKGTTIGRKKVGNENEVLGLATAVCVKEEVVVLNVQSNRKSRSFDFLKKVFKILNDYQLIADLVSTSEVNLSMALSKPDEERLTKAVDDLNQVGFVQVLKDLVIISLIGEMISQGSSEINISGVISKASVPQALNTIHKQLLLGETEKLEAKDGRMSF